MLAEVGDRVLATLGSTGLPRQGTVTGYADLPPLGRQYTVTFDGSSGRTLPCEIVRLLERRGSDDA